MPEEQKGGQQEIKELLQKSEISLWLDHYDDIFSDFDPRSYAQRGISDDFLKEARKFTKEVKSGVLELRFLVPGNHRKAEQEATIRKRLREHFRKHADLLRKERDRLLQKGVMMAATGFLLLILGATVLHFRGENFLWSLAVVVIEPAGWFTVWHGLDQIILKSKELRPEREFNEKMAKAEVKFDAY